MNTVGISFFVLLTVLAPSCFAKTIYPAPQPTRLPKPFPCPLPPVYATRITATGAKERVLLPCRTPDPCKWPIPQAITQASIQYPPHCCPILYRKLSARTAVPYPLPFPCRTPFPLPLPTRKPECASCRSGSECLQGKCWGSPLKCTDGEYDGLLRCGFKAECESCTSGLQCATKKCWNRKCVFDTEESRRKCFH